MFKKIRLFYQIREFYKAFDLQPYEICIHKVSDITKDNLFDVLYDINEILYVNSLDANEDAYEIDAWLNDLKKQINNFRERKHHPYIAIMLLVMSVATVALFCGCMMGRSQTIRQAELLKCTDSEYHISYGNEVHVYTTED